jgi:hypothetical protein
MKNNTELTQANLTRAQIESISNALNVDFGSLENGIGLYAQYCSSCHDDLLGTQRRNRTATQIESAINRVTAMQTTELQALSKLEIELVANALKGNNAASRKCTPEFPPRTIQCFYDKIMEQGITTVEDAIPLLPEDTRSALFLMQESKSRHQASQEKPRVILYGHDAEFIVAFSSTPGTHGSIPPEEDAAYEQIELVEFQEDGSFKFSMLDMNPIEGGGPVLRNSEDGGCKSCHHTRERLIWGQYRNWPGNYEIDGSGQVELRTRLPERFKSIISSPYRASLPAWSVEVWNYQQNRLMFKHHSQIMKSSEQYDTAMRYKIVSTLQCADNNVMASLMLEMGFSPRDTRAERPAFEVFDDAGMDWFGGGPGTLMDALFDVAVIDLIYQDGDKELERILKPYADALQPVYKLSQDYYNKFYNPNLGYSLLPFDIPNALNGASNAYLGYGGNYGGLRLRGYENAWGEYPSVYFSRYDLEHDAIEQEFCDYINTKVTQ